MRLTSENHKRLSLKQGKQTSEGKTITQKISLVAINLRENLHLLYIHCFLLLGLLRFS